MPKPCSECGENILPFPKTTTHVVDLARSTLLNDRTFFLCGEEFQGAYGPHWGQIFSAHVTCEKCLELYKTDEGFAKATIDGKPLPEHVPPKQYGPHIPIRERLRLIKENR